MFSKAINLFQDYLIKFSKPQPNSLHIDAAAKWLFRAQDATPDRGVSHSYLIGKGWAPSYPETTGYIIPTLLNLQIINQKDECQKRALEMADWEMAIQFADGSLMGGTIGSGTGPVVFNTGQVLFGLIAAYRKTGKFQYLDSARKAGDWLVKMLNSEGIWAIHGNMGANKEHTYNIRVTWALLELGAILEEGHYGTAMEREITWVLGQEVDRGWFRNNCLTDDDYPLLHTIAYTARGLLECGRIINCDKCLAAAKRTADALMKHIRDDGFMPGRFNKQWQKSANWACLTGMMQMSIVWQKLYMLTDETQYKEAALKVNSFVKRTHNTSSPDSGIRGGVKGSYPVNGSYGKYRVLNWATKFFLDALILEEYPNLLHNQEYYAG